MKRLIAASLLSSLAAASVPLIAQSQTPFKLGTFQQQGRTFVGAVVRDSIVIDLAAAHARVQPASSLTMPTEMKDLITRYGDGVRNRIAQIVTSVNAAAPRPAYVYDLAAVKTMPPIVPATILNAAVNYREHAAEMAAAAPGQPGRGGPEPPGTAPAGTKSAPGIWERKADDTRWNPYMFLKAPSAVIADGEVIRIPPRRSQIDWECEMAVVVGRTSSRVAAAQASDYIFGYTLQMDVSDREGRGDSRHGSDWLIGKSHDTFAPLGPFIVPKEFVPNPQKLPIKFTLNGTVMQDADTSLMIHDVYELLAYGSNILTLRPGDVIGTGSPSGVGFARNPPMFLKAGDKTVCTYEGVGTLRNSVEGTPATATR